MNKSEILNKMQNLCDRYGVVFELNKDALHIRKYVYHRGQNYRFNRTVEPDAFTHSDFDLELEEWVSIFDKKLNEKLAELDAKENDNK